MAHTWPGTVPGTEHAWHVPGSQQLCRAGLKDPFHRWENRPEKGRERVSQMVPEASFKDTEGLG